MGFNIFGHSVTIPGMPGSGYGDPGVGGTVPIDDPSRGGIANTGSGDLSSIATQIIRQATQGSTAAGSIQSRPDVILPKPNIRPQIPMSTGPAPGSIEGVTTRAGQRRNDTASLIQSVGNIVKGGINKKRANDERDIMHDLAVIQAAASNPDDPHNKMILDKMASDPKVVKRLQKALGYNPLSGDQPGPETQAMMKYGAQVQAKAGMQQRGQANIQPLPNAPPGQTSPQPIANAQPGQQPGSAMQNLMSRMPNTQQINPVVAMQAELIKAGILPKNDMSPKALLDFVTEAMKDKTKQKEIYERAKATNNQTLMRLYDTMTRAGASIDAAKIRADASKYAADKRLQGVREYTKERDRTIDNLTKTSAAYGKSIAELGVEIATALKQSGGKDNDQIKRLRDEQTRLKSLKNSIDDTAKKYMDIVPDAKGVDELEQLINPPTTDEMNQGDFVFGNNPG